VPRKRLEVLPLAALVLHRVLVQAKPARLIFTAMGLREGCLYDDLPPAIRRRDPLLDACERMAVEHGRFPLDGHDLYAWLAPLFRNSNAEQDRLRLAACFVGDIAWHEHPDYRADIAFLRVLRMPFVGVDHPGRAFLAFAVHTRYGGSPEGELLGPAWFLMNEEQVRDAYRLGLALRLAFTISGGAPDMLKRVRLERDHDVLRLRVARSAGTLIGEAVERRLEALADAFDRKAKIKIG
jgi:exopolyphosphatase/guanosine-5'-triphosphate,3'-diphosphate pyrophosphatase